MKPVASILVAAALGSVAMPVLAQDAAGGPPPLPPIETAGQWQGEWRGDWDGPENYRGVWHGTFTGLDGQPVEAEFRGRFIDESQFVSDDGRALVRERPGAWREARIEREVRLGRPGPGMGPGMGPRRRPLPDGYDGPRFAYSPAERAAWIDQCRARLGPVDDGRRERRGRGIGAILGAIGGGIAGNQIAGRGDHALGTVVGAGVGALAGGAIGGAIGADADRRGGEVLDQCEAYLESYETNAARAPAYGPGYGYPGPVTWVRVPIQRERDCGCEVEEVIETAPAPVARRAIPPRATKRVPIAPAPSKKVRITQ